MPKKKKRKKKLKRPPTTQNGWVNRWKRSMQDVRENIDDLWCDREMFRFYRDTIMSNPALDKSNGFLWLIEAMYWNHYLIGIRKLTDEDVRTHSLYNVIAEIRDNCNHLTKAWFVKRYRDENRGLREFERDWSGRKHIGKRRVATDLRLLNGSCRKIRNVVNKYLAHNDRRKQIGLPSYNEADAAFDTILKLGQRYYCLLYNRSCGTPVDLPFAGIFDIPWRQSSPHPR